MKGCFTILFFAFITSGQAQTVEVLHSFEKAEGFGPSAAGLLQGKDGNLYGTLTQGGDLSVFHGRGAGTAFKLTPDRTFTVLVTFDTSNGTSPSGLIDGKDGFFYSTTSAGGDLSLNNGNGNGTVFRLSPEGTLTTLAVFNEETGPYPGGLVLGSDGNFYGKTSGVNAYAFGGNNYGSFFRMSPDGRVTTLYRFKAGSEAYPLSRLIEGSDGNFYGTTEGAASNGGESGLGIVYAIARGGVLSSLGVFNGAVGSEPVGLVEGPDGAFYGTTIGGGQFGGGTVFRVGRNSPLTALVSFNIPPNSDSGPWAGLCLARDGNFYGTTHGGATGYGAVFKVTPDGALTVVAQFNGSNGANPEALLIQGRDGNLYGTTYFGGANNLGAIFRVALPPAALPPIKVIRSGNSIILSWPATTSDMILEMTEALPATVWAAVTTLPTQIGDQQVVTLEITSENQFFRLRK
jgi:uncharacterized repeat protein (TIGR03803 family)